MLMDKLDKMNKLKYYKGNLIKWWSINNEELSNSYIVGQGNTEYYIVEEEEENYLHDDMMTPECLSEDELNLLLSISEQTDNTNTFENVQNQLLLDEANEIFNRLQSEAASDEALKQAEIDAALASLSL